MLQSGSLLLFLNLLLLTLNPAAVCQNVHRLWSADLSKDPDFQKRVQDSGVNVRPPTLNFLNQNQVIVAFDDDAILFQPEMKPIAFHVLEVDASSGRLGRKLSFETTQDTSQAEAIGDGTFLVLSGEELKKYSSSFKELTSKSTPLRLHGQPTERKIGGLSFSDAHYETWQMHVARGGGELVLAHKKNVHEMEVSWLRTRDFSTVDTVEGAPFNHETLASPEQQVWAYPRKWAKQLMLSGELLPFCNGCRTAYFLTDDLAVLEEKGKYQIKTSSGETRANSKVNCGMFGFSLAATATRFAYAAGCYRGGGFPIQTHFAAHMDVDVFDWGTMKRTCRLKFDEPEKASIGGFKDSAIALSNDGRQLLVLTGSTLSLYRLE